ncbi:EamA family transporter RarD [Shimia aestuarii]|uniref:Chloramphenicol-sensitive protein RarD n=1 Tax=Shimia aestuarii TaxID=254406 RepID=A0A1I4N813_9RHOB|nr:EamA family transporter RarD [Shimia aestuarii]SFM11651.1 chloramphenicol-sensitive protein RarD [Shimia aestuarii]
MNERKRALLAMILACVIWGLSPLYYKLLAHIAPIEVLAHRTIWSATLFAGLLMVQGRQRELAHVGRPLKQGAAVLIAALLISTNWFVFISAVGSDQATEASMGYFLFPLVSVLLGRVVLGERQSTAQWLAVGLAGLAVLVLTVGLGVAPWIALILSGTFGLYGLLKKRLPLGPVVSVTAEVLLLCPIAILVLWHFHSSGGGVFGQSLQDSVLLVFSGALTATPLILFSRAARQLPLSTVGLMQYLNPTLQFLCAVVIFAEPFSLWHMIAFPMIWAALALYSLSSWRQEKVASRTSVAPATSSTT